GAGVHDRLSAVWIDLAVKHTARSEVFPEVGILGRGRIVGQLRLLHRVQVVKEAEELVEAVAGGQEFVLVSEVVLAKLSGGVAQRLQQFRNGRIFAAQ